MVLPRPVPTLFERAGQRPYAARCCPLQAVEGAQRALPNGGFSSPKVVRAANSPRQEKIRLLQVNWVLKDTEINEWRW